MEAWVSGLVHETTDGSWLSRIAISAVKTCAALCGIRIRLPRRGREEHRFDGRPAAPRPASLTGSVRPRPA